MKFGQAVEYIKKNILLERRRQVPELFVFEESIIRGKSKWSVA